MAIIVAMARISFLGLILTLFLALFSGSATSLLQEQYQHFHHHHNHHYHHHRNPRGIGYPYTEPEQGCEDVLNNFDACEPYIVGEYNDVPEQCCNGLLYLNHVAKNEYGGARRICQCIEGIGASRKHQPYSELRIENLYSRCNIHLSFPISECMDCSRVYT